MTPPRSPLRNTAPLRAALLAGALAPALTGCLVGPNYVRPTPLPAATGAQPPAAFKEAQGWTPAKPLDALDKGAWWSVYNDPTLDALMRRVAVTNQNVAQAEANYRNARAMVQASRSNLFPTLTASLQFQRTGSLGNNSNIITTGGSGGTIISSGGSTTTGTTTGTGTTSTGTVSTGGVNSVVTSSGGSGASNRFDGSLDASWAPDPWGRIRRQVEGRRARAQASAADLANATLSAQAELATDYFNLRLADATKKLYADTVAAYQRSVQVTQNQYNAGIVARADVITAQTQLQGAQANLIDVDQQRATYEHAIAVLVGEAPASLTLAVGPLPTDVPVAPAGLPSTLLERRPDIAAAERQVKSANAAIGVAVAAYYPDLTLSGSLGASADDFGRLFNVQNSVWSLGSSLAETLIDFGARRAAVREARATYDGQVALYRQTVLTAFQTVEDQLAALRVLQQEQAVREQEEASARLSEQLALNQYRAGQVAYTTVITAQALALSASQTVLTVRANRLNASVALIQALGGGWTQADLPKV